MASTATAVSRILFCWLAVPAGMIDALKQVVGYLGQLRGDFARVFGHPGDHGAVFFYLLLVLFDFGNVVPECDRAHQLVVHVKKAWR